MNLIINGEELQVSDVRSVSELLDHLKLDGKRVAVEVNLEIVRREARSSFALHENDKIEIVSFIGGG